MCHNCTSSTKFNDRILKTARQHDAYGQHSAMRRSSIWVNTISITFVIVRYKFPIIIKDKRALLSPTNSFTACFFL